MLSEDRLLPEGQCKILSNKNRKWQIKLKLCTSVLVLKQEIKHPGAAVDLDINTEIRNCLPSSMVLRVF